MKTRSHLSSLILRGLVVAASAAPFAPAHAANNVNLVKPESVAAQKKATKKAKKKAKAAQEPAAAQ